ncbi:MAG: transcriptional repressor LexA, partial [Clostridia bacterium]|nr:transcriptional repressor LexA [Clostridia bacterium]
MLGPRADIEKSIYDFVNSYIDENKVNPTFREISSAVGFKSISGISRHIKRMEADGRLIVNGKRGVCTDRQQIDTVNVPVIESIACGTPILAEENVEDYIPVLKGELGKGEFFALRAHGDSMIGAGINDGELVFVRKQETAEIGDIVVALIDDEATLKRYYRDEVNHKIILKPENDKYKDMMYDNVIIQGKA